MSIQNSDYYFLQGGGEMGALIREKDWSQTALGDPSDWPQALRTMVAVMLDNPFGMYIAWGNDYTQIYNDGYRPILGATKHPQALGISTEKTFAEIWNTIGPMFDGVMQGKAVGFSDFMLELNRFGYEEVCYFDFSYSPIRKEDGTVGGVLATVTETTNKKKTVEALKESEKRFQLLVNDATAAIAVLTGPDMKVEIANEAYGRLINLKPHELIGKPLFSMVPDAEAYYLPIMEKVLQTGEMVQLYDSPFAINVNGQRIEGYLHVVYQPYRDADGNIVGVMSILQDVTEAVLARIKIEQSEKKFEAAILAMQGIIWTNSANGEMIGEQPGWATLTGQCYEDYQGYGWASAVHPDDAEPTVKAWNHAVANRSTFEFEHRVDTKLHGWRLFSVKAIPTFDQDGSILQWVGVHTDITEQKEAIQKIKESEDRFKSIADESPMIVFIVDPDPLAPVSYWNKTWLNYTGQTLEEAAGKGWNGIIHPDDIQVFMDIYTPAFALRQAYFVPAIRIMQFEGDYRWHSFKSNPRYLSNCEFNGYIGVGFDVHEQKLAEQKIAYRTALLEAHNEASVDGILLVDAQGKILSFNQRFVEIWNMPQQIVNANDDEAALSFALTQLVNPDEFIDKVKYFYQHPTETCHDELEFKDGKIVDRNGYAVVGEDGTYYAWSWIFKDITLQKNYERAIIESEKSFRLLADSMPQHIWTSDPEGNINYYNQSVYDYSGLTLEQINKDGWIQIVHPEDREENINEWINSITTGNDFLFEHRFRRHDGAYRWQLSRAIPQKDEDGKIKIWVGTSTDIQEQKTFTNELESQVFKRTKELENSNLELEKKNKELESFAFISSHDLQEPLRKIQMFSSRIVESEYDALSQTGKDIFNRMELAAKRMQTLIQDLLTYSRVGDTERKFETISLNTIVEEVSEDLSEELKDKNAIIEANNLGDVEIIPFQFRQLMHNLIGNALKFSIPNQPTIIKVTYEMANGKHFNIGKLKPQTNYNHISIADNGIGFQQQYSEKIFEVFQRLHEVSQYKGTGIGLSIVKKIVENHEGIITAKGEPNKGATFDIYIPVR